MTPGWHGECAVVGPFSRIANVLLAAGLLAMAAPCFAQVTHVTGTQIAPVFGSAGGERRSYLRIFNAAPLPEAAEVVFLNPLTGAVIGRWAYLIPSMASPEFSLATIETEASPPISAAQSAAGYSLVVRSEFAGQVQHVVRNATSSWTANMSYCGDRTFSASRVITNVPSSRLAEGALSRLYVSNEQASTRYEQFEIHDALTGAYLGFWNNIHPDGTLPAGLRRFATSAVESGIKPVPPATIPARFNIIRHRFGTGIMRHLTAGRDAGTLTDMSGGCYLDGSAETTPAIKPVPANLGRDPFYKKYINIAGIPVVASEKVPDAALLRARQIVLFILRNRPDLLLNIVLRRDYFIIAAQSEMARHLPEFAGRNVDDRLRGSVEPTFMWATEETILQYPPDNVKRDYFLHEFVHIIEGRGFDHPYYDQTFDAELEAIFQDARASGVYDGRQEDGSTYYGMTNKGEYFAEAIRAYHDVLVCYALSPNRFVTRLPCTRQELRTHDRRIHDFIQKHFGEGTYPPLN
jgi:hypothetical protein